MDDRSRGTSCAQEVRYCECWWGDLLYGTKAQLQRYGLGVGRAFPGEPGGPRKELRVTDPRGYRVVISNRTSLGHEAVFSAGIYFDRERENTPWQLARRWAPMDGGLAKREGVFCDEYKGTADALCKVAPLHLGMFPGQPGAPKTRARYTPAGGLVVGSSSVDCRKARQPGALLIEVAGAS